MTGSQTSNPDSSWRNRIFRTRSSSSRKSWKRPPSQSLLTPQVLLRMCRHSLTARVKCQQKLAAERLLALPHLLLQLCLPILLQTHCKELPIAWAQTQVPVVVGGAVTDVTGSDTLVKSMTDLIKAQMQAMTRLLQFRAIHHWTDTLVKEVRLKMRTLTDSRSDSMREHT